MKAILRLAAVTAIWILYVLTCAGIMQAIEDSHDMSMRSVFSTDIRSFLDDVNSRNISGSQPVLAETDLVEFLYRIETPLKRSFLKNTRLGLLSDTAMMGATWKYSHSVLFICALVTTVGYGNIIPVSEAGKGFSVFVILTGVPLTIAYYYVWIYTLLPYTSKVSHKYYRTMRGLGFSSVAAKIWPVCTVLVAEAIFVILLPASFYYACEPEWSYITAIYYCTLTLATAGLGDFVPMHSARCGDYVVATAIYIVNAVFLTMFMLANVLDIHEIEDDDDELKPLTLPERVNEVERHESKEDRSKTPSPVVRDLYLTGIGR